MHVAENPNEKPRWIPLVRWEDTGNPEIATQAQQAGRVLADFIGCPMKAYGIKRQRQIRATGPLESHDRVDITAYKVQQTAKNIALPIQYQGLFVTEGRNDGLTLRISKGHSSRPVEPAYQLCEIDPKEKQC